MGWDYCCCAIPVLNVGAYLTLSEQFVLGILVGTLSFATPSLVGASVPFSAANLILMALGYIFAFIQLIGFFGIFKEKPGLFRHYVLINSIVLYLTFGVAAAFIGISAARHSQAVAACKTAFFSSDANGEQICNIFCWSTLGVMGVLWLLLFFVQSYLILVLRNYGVTQRADHTKYHSIYSTHDGDNNIMLNNVRSGTYGDEEAWNTRPSTDSWHPRGGEHSYRDDDDPGHSEVLPPVPVEKPEGTGYGVGAGVATPLKQASVDDAYLEHPSKTMNDPAPVTTTTGANYYDPPPGNPPSYHGHGSVDDHGTSKQGWQDTPKQTWQKDQPYNPYQASGSRM